MRTLIISSVIMLAVIVGWVFLFQSVNQDTSDLIALLDTLEKNVNQEAWNEAHSHFPEVQKRWHQVRSLWAVFLHHHEIDNIDLAMARADQYIQQQSASLSLGEIGVLKQLFKIVKESESVTLTNIL